MHKFHAVVFMALAVLLMAPATGIREDRAQGLYFVDSTATLMNAENIHFGELVYVAPFASLIAGADAEHAIHIGHEADVQDSVTMDATTGEVRLGQKAILAHGATVRGPAEIGEGGACQDGADHCPSFVSFNAIVDGAVVQKDAMVSGLARVGPGVTIPSGLRVLPGMNVTSDDQVAAKTAPVTGADREFMAGVVEANACFAEQYTALAAEDPANVTGINFNPGECAFNPTRQLPALDGVPVREPDFRNRIIGDVRLSDELEDLDEVMGAMISLRADEGEPFSLGEIKSMADRVTFHALEHTHLELGEEGTYGFRSIVHGGPSYFDSTTTGSDFVLGDRAVFFQSQAGDDVTIGNNSLVQQSSLPSGAVVPPCTIMIDNEVVGSVEWC